MTDLGMTDPDRFAYLPITERPRLLLPNGARIAVWICRLSASMIGRGVPARTEMKLKTVTS